MLDVREEEVVHLGGVDTASAEHSDEVRARRRGDELRHRFCTARCGPVYREQDAVGVANLERQVLQRLAVDRWRRRSVTRRAGHVGLADRGHRDIDLAPRLCGKLEPVFVGCAVEADAVLGRLPEGPSHVLGRCTLAVVGVVDDFQAVAVAPLDTTDVVVLEANEGGVERGLHQLRLIDRADVAQTNPVAMLMREHVVHRTFKGVSHKAVEPVISIDLHVAVAREEVVSEGAAGAAIDCASADTNVATNAGNT